MLGFGALRRAIMRLASALESLANTTEEVNSVTRSRLGLDADEEDVAHVRRLPAELEAETDTEGNGEALPVPAGKKGKRS